MNVEMFFVVLGILWLAIFAQFLDAGRRGWATHTQMRRRHGLGERDGYSMAEHGGILIDVPLSVVFAYFVAKYRFPWFSDLSIGILGGWYVVWNIMTLLAFVPAGRIKPEAHTAYGRVFPAMHIHNVYAAGLSWIATMVFLPGFSTPAISVGGIWFLAICLCIWSLYGVRKFNRFWKAKTQERRLVVAEIVGILALAVWRTI